MGEPKPIASLTSGLLARKGQAAPAMRRQSMMLAAISSAHDDGHEAASLEDLGWNDMGDAHEPVRQTTGLSPMPVLPTPVLVPVEPPAPVAAPQPITPDVAFAQPEEPPVVVRQQEELARDMAQPAAAVALVEVAPLEQPKRVAKAPAARVAAGARGKAAFTLRLDADRHLQLRLTCAINHRSAQQIVTQALDEFLARQPTVSELIAATGKH